MDELLSALRHKGDIAVIADHLGLRYPTVWAWYKLGRRPSRESMDKILAAYPDLMDEWLRALTIQPKGA
jgi:hypothetical protein